MKELFWLFTLCILCSCKKINYSHENLNYTKATIYRDSNHTDSAFYYYNIAKNDFIKIKDSIGAAKALINMAYIQTNGGDFLGGVGSSLEANKFINSSQDSLRRSLLGKSYNNMAIASNSLHNYKDAYRFYQISLQYLEINEDKYICYNNIGDVLITLNQLKPALKYLEKAVWLKIVLIIQEHLIITRKLNIFTIKTTIHYQSFKKH